jgi:glycosyltransferase involved in cell wall biosynthesis
MVFFIPGYQKAYSDFIFNVLSSLTTSLADHDFILIFDGLYDQRFVFSSKVTPVIVAPLSRNPLLWRYWMDIKVPATLRKSRADVFISGGWCSLATSVPQCLLIPYFRFSDFVAEAKASPLLFAERYLQRFLKKTQVITTASEFLKQEIIDQYKIGTDKIHVVYGAAREIFKPVSDEVAQAVKSKLTAGREFFLCSGPLDPQQNLIALLKAFSIFKKRQKSNMKLLLAGSIGNKYDVFIQNLKTYKYRDDLVMLTDLKESELADVGGSAYAFLYVALQSPGISIIEAMQCQVPVIAAKESVYEIARDAALYADTNSFEDIADKMMLIYKDDNLRKALIENEKAVASYYSWQRTAELIWKSILNAVD